MPIDNNLLERDIRIFATGRKSWLFSDTVDGAKASAVSLQPDADLPRLHASSRSRGCATSSPNCRSVADDADITDLPFNFPKTATAA
jgi:transposase